MLDPQRAKRVERFPQPSGGYRYVYVYDCIACPGEVRTRTPKRATGRCRACASRHPGGPYRSRYNNLVARARRYHPDLDFDITYEEYVEMTQVGCCCYCAGPVDWTPYKSQPINLDRSDSKRGYVRGNVVVCCGPCNRMKSFYYDKREFEAILKLLEVWRASSEREKEELFYELLDLACEKRMQMVSWDASNGRVAP